MIAPIAAPSTPPMASTSRMTRNEGVVGSSEAEIIVVSATTEPTDRSMPPVRMTNVMPTATTSRNALSMKTFRMIWPVAKPSYRMPPATNIATNSAPVTSTGR